MNETLLTLSDAFDPEWTDRKKLACNCTIVERSSRSRDLKASLSCIGRESFRSSSSYASSLLYRCSDLESELVIHIEYELDQWSSERESILDMNAAMNASSCYVQGVAHVFYATRFMKNQLTERCEGSL